MEKPMFTFIESEKTDITESFVCDPNTGLCGLPETKIADEKQVVEKGDENA